MIVLGFFGCSHAPLVAGGPVDPVVEARNLTKAGEIDRASDRFEQILRAEPKNLAAHRGLVEAAYYAGRLGETAERYRKMAEKPGSEGLGYYGLGLVEVARGPGNMEAALANFGRAATLMPEEADIPHRMGLIYLMNGEHQKARDAFQQALALDPDRADVRVACAGALIQLGREKEAIEVMQRILTLSPSAEVAEKARAISSKVFDPLRETTPEVAQDLRLALDYLHEDSVQQALSLVEKLISSHPQVAFAYSLKGLAHSRLENNGEAVVAFERALELRPECPATLVGLGDVYLRLEKWQKARECYEKAVQLDPFDLEAHQRMGELARARQDSELTSRSYGTLVLLDPGNVSYRHQWALSLATAGHYQEAVGAYEGILGINPEDLEALVRLGSLHLTLGEKDPTTRAEHRRKAQAFLEQVHELIPENQAVVEMLSKLED